MNWNTRERLYELEKRSVRSAASNRVDASAAIDYDMLFFIFSSSSSPLCLTVTVEKDRKVRG